MKIINLTAHESTLEQAYAGVREIDCVFDDPHSDERFALETLRMYLREWAEDEVHCRDIARGIALCAKAARNDHGVTAALIDGSPRWITILSGALRLAGVTPITTTQMYQQLNPTRPPTKRMH